MTARLLIVDDEPAICLSLSRYLTRVGFSTSDVSTLERAGAALAAERFEAVLLDLDLPDGNGLDFIDEIRTTYPDMAIIVVTGTREIRTAVQAMQRGADHFLEKPVDMAGLEVFLKKGIEVGKLRRRSVVQQRLGRTSAPFLGHSQGAIEAREMAELAAETDATVLLTGETGTGKGVMARWIHDQSSRRGPLFVEVNCSSLRGEILGNELFGHARGAFTSAVDARPGLLDSAHEGTLFLDEIGDMDPPIQPQFLKVLEEKRYRRLGEVQTRQSDFRLICASNRVLEDEVTAGRFRADLFHRLNVLRIAMPPLRAMGSDFDPLVRYLLSTLSRNATMDASATDVLRDYDWPGNIRELRNVLERAALLARGAPIGREHLRSIERSTPAEVLTARSDSDLLLLLERFGGDKSRLARELGISRATLYRRLHHLRHPVK